jgi:hypothetical protein
VYRRIEGNEIAYQEKEARMAGLISQLFSSKSSTSIRVPSGKIYDVEDAFEKPARSLKHFLKLNYAEHALHANTVISDFVASYNNIDHV